jgi:hypothetical protein
MSQSGREDCEASDFYVVLGDDSAITSCVSDPDNIVRSCYVNLCQDVGLEINHSKSHLTDYNNNVANAEFAKVKVLDGKINTPVPIRLVSRLSRSKGFYHRIATVIWMSSNGYSKVNGITPRLIEEHFSDPASSDAVNSLLQSGFIAGFDSLLDPAWESKDIDPKMAFCYLLTKVKGSILAGMLHDHELELSFDNPEKLWEQPLFLLKDSDIERYTDNIKPNHKIWSLLDRNLLIEDSIKSILGATGVTTNRLVTGLIDLDEDEIELFLELDNQLKNIELGLGLSETSSQYFRRLVKATEKLDRFSTRSFIKRRVHDLRFVEDTILLKILLFPESQVQMS